jgi:uncharacterized membrane protein (DUF2068 family)
VLAVHRPLGVRLIIAYKLVKAPLVLLVAALLTTDPAGALAAAERVTHDLSEGGALLSPLARVLDANLTERAVGHAAMIAWLDGLVTAAEAFLLWHGDAWGEWLVVGTLGALVPLEALSLGRHPSAPKLALLLANAAIIAYLVHLRLRARRAKGARAELSAGPRSDGR